MNIQRQLFFLMRKKLYDPEEKAESGKDVEGSDVKQEFENSLMPKYRISGFRSVQRTKKYAFEKAEVPDSAEYLEVRYPFSDPILPEDLTGDSFSLVFGRNTSALEIFLLDRKVKGPCWLDILDAVPSQSKSTWCAEEFVAHSPAKVMLAKCDAKPPPIVIMALQLKIVVDPKTKHNDIVAVAAVVNTKFPVNTAAPKELFDFHFSIVAQDSRQDASRRFPRAFKQLIENNKKYNAAAVDSEKALLDSLLFRIQSVDPDLLVFHDAVGHNLDILLQRLVASMKGQSWSRLGRLKRSEIPKGRNAGAVAATGRLICDIKHSAEELIHNKSYDLTELVQVVLKDPSPRQEIESDFIQDMFRSNDTLERLIDSTLMDASYIVGIMAELNALPLALQITNIAGNVLSRTLLGGRSERNEFLLLHAFNARNYICPDKQFRDFHKKDPKLTAKKGQAKVKTATQADETGLEEDFAATALVDEEKENPGDEVVGNAEATQQAPGAKRKPTYAGGLVLDPKKGLYDSFVLLMDFNSLYPSIIQEYNICFTTIDRKAMANAKQEDYLPDLPDSSVETGVLPTEIKMLVERRQEVKKLIKQTNAQDVDKLIELDIRQKALKLTANSMYGCLGFNASRFFARPLAALVTAKGREILMNTKELIEKLNLEVIYGDTDSVMINTRLLDWDAVIKIGSEVKSKVDKHYKSLKLDVDGVFRSLLLLQKKKYAALVASRRDGKLVFTRELKGLDIVRRDWSQLAADTGKFVIDQILSDAPTNQPRDDVQGKILAGIKCVGEFMRSSGEGRTSLAAVFDNKYFVVRDELELYVITKALNKDPQFYADAKSLPHVQVAQRWNQSQPSRKLRLGSTVPYIICNEAPPGVVSIGGGKVPHTQRAYHIEEVQRNPDTLTVDRQYYLAEQVHKVVSRLCEPIDGVDSVTLAECLGIDRNAYSRFYVNRSAQEEDATAQGLVSDVELYKDCLPLTLVCPECRNNWTFDEPIWEKDEDRWLSLLKCAFCEARPFDYVIKIHNTLRLQIGLALQRYYKPVFVCQDVGCHYQCGFVPPKFHRGQPVCPKCEAAILKPEFSDRDLYLQLCYWKNAFDPKRALEKIKNKSWHGRLESAYNDPAVTAGYGMLTSFVQSFLDQSSYGRVNLSDFFPPPQPSVNISSLPASEF